MVNVPASRSNPFATIYSTASALSRGRGNISGIANVAAQHHAITEQNEQQAQLQEAAAVSEHSRRMEFFNSILQHAEAGTGVNFQHGNMSLALTKSTQPSTPPQGRVPVKKNRGGKKNR
jgi:hypothetical protein